MSHVMLMASAGSVVNPLPLMTVSDLRLSPATASASITVNSDGTISYTGNTSSGPTKWFNPPLAGVGNRYWVRLTLGTIPAADGGSASAGVWLALSSNRTWTWSLATIATKAGSGTIAIASDAAGANIVGSGTLSVDVEVN